MHLKMPRAENITIVDDFNESIDSCNVRLRLNWVESLDAIV